MMIFEVLNYYDRSRYFVSAKSESEMLLLIDNKFLNDLKEMASEDDDISQYEDLINDKDERMEYIEYTVVMKDATFSNIVENNLEGDLNKFYF